MGTAAGKKGRERVVQKIILGLFLTLAFGGFVFIKTQETDVLTHSILSRHGGDLAVHFIDVGQADCILIQADGENMLVDAGNNDDVRTVVDYLHKQGVEKLKYVIGTHGHEDHIGGMDGVIEQFEIEELFLPGQSYETKSYEDVIKAAIGKQLDIKDPRFKEKIEVGETDVLFVTPDANDDYEDLNDSSLGIRLVNGKHSFLMCGDASAGMEKQMLESRIYLRADILKVSHHGSNDTSSLPFLKRVSPEFAVLSCGRDNDFGHPHKKTLNKLKKLDIQLFRTDEQGTIIFMSDGNRLTCNVHPIQE